MDYLTHDLTDADAELVEHLLNRLREAPQVPDTMAALQRLETRLDAGVSLKSRVKSNTHGWLRYAALTAACLIAVLFVWRDKEHTNKVDSNNYLSYSTRAGQRAQITLSNGSRVILGPVTTLRVRKTTSTNDPLYVDMAGEALFSVSHSATHPLLVNTHGVTTRVLGTEFIIRAYDASLVKVAVREGRVSVQSQSLTAANAAVVGAGEAASVTPNALPVVVPIADLATDFAWASGKLVLRDVPLGEAFVRLSRWYGVEFRASDPSLLKSRVDAVFPSEFSPMEIDALAQVIGARITKSSGVITFSEGR